MADRKFGIETLALHAGQIPDPATGSRAVPLYQTTSYVFDSADHAASLFNLQTFGNVYTRISNPTTAVLEERVAALEGGRAALATATGQAAEMTAFLTLAEAGDHVVSASTLYGGTYTLLEVNLRKLGIDTTFVSPDDPENFRRAIRKNTKILYAETLGNFGYTMRARMETLRTFGPALSPFNAWLLLQGLETLPVRMERHCENALAVAKFLEGHARVSWINYPGLPGNKYHKLGQKYLPKGASGLLNFGVKGGAKAGERFIEAATFMSHLANIGDAKTLIIPPASTTHRQMSEEEQAKAGVTPDMIRISVGLETLDDILWDIDNALSASAKP